MANAFANGDKCISFSAVFCPKMSKCRLLRMAPHKILPITSAIGKAKPTGLKSIKPHDESAILHLQGDACPFFSLNCDRNHLMA